MIKVLIIILVLLIILINKKDISKLESEKYNILILTVEDRDLEYINIHDKILNLYSKKYNYEYIRLKECNDINVYWCKIYKVLEYLLTGKYDYVLWTDSDTIINKLDKSLEYYINLFNKDIIIGVDCWEWCSRLHILNSGVFMVKNSKIGISFLQDCINEYNNKLKECTNTDNTLKGTWAGECYEQGTMNDVLLYKNNYKAITHIDLAKEMIFNYSITFNRDYLTSESFIIHLCTMTTTQKNKIFKEIMRNYDIDELI